MEVEWHLFLPRDRRYGAFGGNLHADQPLNRIVYLSGGAYNLASRGDLSALTIGAEFHSGKKAAPQDQEMLDQLRSLGYIGGGPRGEAGAGDKDEAARGRVGGGRGRRHRLGKRPKGVCKSAPPAPCVLAARSAASRDPQAGGGSGAAGPAPRRTRPCRRHYRRVGRAPAPVRR